MMASPFGEDLTVTTTENLAPRQIAAQGSASGICNGH